jgi:type II secretory pathway pseudopilin PulG
MTFLEVVLAIALMGLIFAAVYSAFGFVGAMSRREQQKLAAAELANALIVQYLDDPNSLPTTQPIDYGPWRFRYARAEEDVTFREARPAPATTLPRCAPCAPRAWARSAPTSTRSRSRS